MAEKIGRLIEIVLSGKKSKCERCNTWPAHNHKKWCKKCQNWWNRHNYPDKHTAFLQEKLGLMYYQAKLYHLAPKLLALFQSIPWEKGVMLWGDVGCGKTYAMAALARRFYIQGWDIEFVRWYELVLNIKNAAINTGDEMLAIKPYIEVDKLFIDDIGVAVGRNSQETSFNLRTLELIIDKRIANFKPIYITSNKPIEDLASSFDCRVASRIQEMCIIVQTTGKDRRVQE